MDLEQFGINFMVMHPFRAEFGDDALLEDVVFDEDRHYSNDEIMTVALEQLSGEKLEALLDLQIDIFISRKQTHAGIVTLQ